MKYERWYASLGQHHGPGVFIYLRLLQWHHTAFDEALSSFSSHPVSFQQSFKSKWRSICPAHLYLLYSVSICHLCESNLLCVLKLFETFFFNLSYQKSASFFFYLRLDKNNSKSLCPSDSDKNVLYTLSVFFCWCYTYTVKYKTKINANLCEYIY